MTGLVSPGFMLTDSLSSVNNERSGRNENRESNESSGIRARILIGWIQIAGLLGDQVD